MNSLEIYNIPEINQIIMDYKKSLETVLLLNVIQDIKRLNKTMNFVEYYSNIILNEIRCCIRDFENILALLLLNNF